MGNEDIRFKGGVKIDGKAVKAIHERGDENEYAVGPVELRLLHARLWLETWAELQREILARLRPD